MKKILKNIKYFVFLSIFFATFMQNLGAMEDSTTIVESKPRIIWNMDFSKHYSYGDASITKILTVKIPIRPLDISYTDLFYFIIYPENTPDENAFTGGYIRDGDKNQFYKNLRKTILQDAGVNRDQIDCNEGGDVLTLPISHITMDHLERSITPIERIITPTSKLTGFINLTVISIKIKTENTKEQSSWMPFKKTITKIPISVEKQANDIFNLIKKFSEEKPKSKKILYIDSNLNTITGISRKLIDKVKSEEDFFNYNFFNFILKIIDIKETKISEAQDTKFPLHITEEKSRMMEEEIRRSLPHFTSPDSSSSSSSSPSPDTVTSKVIPEILEALKDFEQESSLILSQAPSSSGSSSTAKNLLDQYFGLRRYNGDFRHLGENILSMVSEKIEPVIQQLQEMKNSENPNYFTSGRLILEEYKKFLNSVADIYLKNGGASTKAGSGKAFYENVLQELIKAKNFYLLVSDENKKENMEQIINTLIEPIFLYREFPFIAQSEEILEKYLTEQNEMIFKTLENQVNILHAPK